MGVIAERITLGTAAVRIDIDDTDYTSGTSLAARCHTTDWYIGGPDVTPETGALVLAGEWLPVDQGRGDEYWAVLPTGTAELHVLRAGVNR